MSGELSIDPNTIGMEEFPAGENPAILATFTIVRICLTVFGLIANTIAGVVLTNRKLWSPTSMLLLSLVAYDAMFLLASIPPCVMAGTTDVEVYAILMGVCYPLRFMAQTGSIYTTVTVTIERFLVVFRPLKARVLCTFGNTRRVILAVFLFSVLFNIPRCFIYLLFTSSHLSQNLTAIENNTVSFLSSQSDRSDVINYSIQPITNVTVENTYYKWLYLRVYELYISSVLFYLLPYTFIPILNLQLLLAIKKRRKETRRISVKNEHQVNNTKPTYLEDGLTLIVLGITVCFFICCLVPAIYNITQIAEVPNSAEIYYLLSASDTMLCINASTDFFFYCLLGRKFRNIFLYLFCHRVFGRKSYNLTSSHFKASHKNSEACYHSV